MTAERTDARRRAWSEDELRVLREFVALGKTDEEIAQVLLCRSVQGIQEMRYKLKLPSSGTPKVRIDLDAYAKMMKGESTCL